MTQTCGLTYPPLQYELDVVSVCVLSHGADPSSDGRPVGRRGAVGWPAQANVAKAAAKRATRMAGRDIGRSGLVERHTY